MMYIYVAVVLVLTLATKLSSADLVHSCLPDGTVQVTNPNSAFYTNVFAVQDQGVSAAVKCTVSTSGAESNITGCSQDNSIVVWFSNRPAGSVETFGGQSAISYEVQCDDLPDAGAVRTVANNLNAIIEVTTMDSVTPSFVISSALRTVSQLGSSTSSATVGDTLYWTIDIPEEYSAKMDCYAYSGTSNSGSPNKFLVDDGCEQDDNLMGSDFDSVETSVSGIKRYWALLYVFKFYNSGDLYFECTVTVCPSGSSNCDISCSRRKRSAGARQLTGPDDKVFSTSSLVHVTPKKSSATTTLGNVWLAIITGLLMLYMKH